MFLLLLAVAVGPPIWALLLAVLVLMTMPWLTRNKARLALELFRRMPTWAPEWASLALFQLAPLSVSGGLPGTTVGITMNVGYPGAYSRNGDCIIQSRQVNPADSVGPLFGDAVFLVGNATGGFFSSIEAIETAGTYTPVMAQGTSSSAAVFAGIGVREIKTMTTFPGSGSTAVGGYLPGQPCDVIVRGSVVVQTANPKSAAAPIAGGKVYLRLSTNGAGTAVGAFEYADDSGHMLLLTNCYWTTGVVDANLAAEITITNRNTP